MELLLIVIAAELVVYGIVRFTRHHFPWMITPLDEEPCIDAQALIKFMEQGFDPELGWIRKPSTEKDEKGKWGTTHYRIDKDGSRADPGHENLETLVSAYGDSFAFGRQVNDNEVWTWHLAEKTKTHVLNFAVGNYGLDQSYLRLQREHPKHKTPIVIIGVVPSTIIRVLSLWKHYNEFGNTFASKPMFYLKNDALELISNRLDTQEKFLTLQEHLSYFREHDYFYQRFFRKEMIRFPYLLHFFKHPYRNIRLVLLTLYALLFENEEKKSTQIYGTPMKVIMERNLNLRVDLFMNDPYANKLLTMLVGEFAAFAERARFTPVLVLLPQKDDVNYIQRHGKYYKHFLQTIQQIPHLHVLDFLDTILSHFNISALYSDDNKYGGHLSLEGNTLLANAIYGFLKNKKLIS